MERLAPGLEEVALRKPVSPDDKVPTNFEFQKLLLLEF